MDSAPKTWFDSKEIIEIRNKVQKPWHQEEYFAWFFIRRYSIYISLLISRYTQITPNQLTVLGILFGVASGLSFSFGTKESLIIGVIFYFITYTLDCVDGEVARLKNMKSKSGAWFDLGLRYSLYFTFFSASTIILRDNHILNEGVISHIIVFCILVSILSTEGTRLELEKVNIAQTMTSIRKKNKLIDSFVSILATEPGYYIALIIMVLFEVGTLIEIWALFHVIIFIIKSLLRYFLTIRRLNKTNW